MLKVLYAVTAVLILLKLIGVIAAGWLIVCLPALIALSIELVVFLLSLLFLVVMRVTA